MSARTKQAATLMIQGTASSVGKSLLVAGACRVFRRRGLAVAPFKSQNMALNAAVTPDGYEIGRAQAVQAVACGLDARVEMNPILIKPDRDTGAQVVVMGRSIGSLSAEAYHYRKREFGSIVAQCLDTLRRESDLVIIEGAGSPAEVNLQSRDIVNMYVADLADAPVLLAGDIDRGGVFAAFVGTLELLEPRHRERIFGFLINKFRGDKGLLVPGLDILEARTGRPTLGVVPFVPRLRIADEDSLALDERPMRATDEIVVAVVRLPRISNFDDVEALEHTDGVHVAFVESPDEHPHADLVIVPGSKSTISDLRWLRSRGWEPYLRSRVSTGRLVLGICGGCQMLGEEIIDDAGVDGEPGIESGLGLLPVRTRFSSEKITADVRGHVHAATWLSRGVAAGEVVRGYEIHMGVVTRTTAAPAPFQIVSRNGAMVDVSDGATDVTGTCVGTMIHGLLENATVRSAIVDELYRRRGTGRPGQASPVPSLDDELDRFADVLEENVDFERIVSRLCRL